MSAEPGSVKARRWCEKCGEFTESRMRPWGPQEVCSVCCPPSTDDDDEEDDDW